MHIRCIGDGSPTVVIDGGTGNWSIFYGHIQLALASEMRVCTYDRAGLGWSETGPLPRTSSVIADELHELIDRAAVRRPLLLVGHSFGGYNVRIYQARHPDEVGGLVLIDAAHEQQWERLAPEWAGGLDGLAVWLRARAESARKGEISEAEIEPAGFLSHAPEWETAYVDAQLSPSTYLTTAAETESALVSAGQVPSGKLGSLPVVVLTARRSFNAFAGAGLDVEEANRVWLELQRELASLSSNIVHLFSEGDHALHESDPDAVVAAIRQGARMVTGTGSPEVPQRAYAEDIHVFDPYIGRFRSETLHDDDSGRSFHHVVEYEWFDTQQTIVRFTIATVVDSADPIVTAEGFYGFDPFQDQLYVFGAFKSGSSGFGSVGEFDRSTHRRVTWARSKNSQGETVHVRDAFDLVDENIWKNVTAVRIGLTGDWQIVHQGRFTRVEE